MRVNGNSGVSAGRHKKEQGKTLRRGFGMSVVMLSGPVGAGKTVVAWELVALSKRPQCYLEGDAF
jgi:tRNA A37 threonylcarbamoyladenosine biosynthesis protein TsaE